MNSYIGIDYGRFAGSNRDDIAHYGVIGSWALRELWHDAIDFHGEIIYPDNCSSCGNDIADKSEDICPSCGKYWSDMLEHISEIYRRDGYVAERDCDLSYIIVSKSPFVTYTAFCSPCFPGAGDLDSPHARGVKTYCFGHDWFYDGKAPYPVYDAITGKEVMP